MAGATARISKWIEYKMEWNGNNTSAARHLECRLEFAGLWIPVGTAPNRVNYFMIHLATSAGFTDLQFRRQHPIDSAAVSLQNFE
jgi:hypothetical protein